MKKANGSPAKWLFGKLVTPVNPAVAKMSEYFRAWDYAHTNDRTIFDADANKERLREALNLRERDPKLGFDQLLYLAEQGSVWSMLKVAWSYRNGHGVAADKVKGEDWYRRAFEAGSESALLDYANILGLRGAHDLREEVYRVGAAKGWAPACYQLANIQLQRARDKRSRREARDLLEQAGQQGCPGAQFLLAQLMIFGRFGIGEVPHGAALMRSVMKRAVAESGDDSANLARAG